MRIARRGWAAVAAAALCLGFSVTGSASAAPGTATGVDAAAAVSGAANAGMVRGKFDPGPVNFGPLARCTVAGQQKASTPGKGVDDSASFGPATSTCDRNKQTGNTLSRTSGKDFVLDAYGWFGDDAVLTIDNYAARCTGLQNRVTAQVAVSGVFMSNGLRVKKLPNPIPPNYEVGIMETKPSFGDRAKIIFNEQVPNGRGGLTVSVAHMHNGGQQGSVKTQDVYLGRADCAPVRR